MSFSYNLTGTARKALVQTISEILGKPAVYQGAPTFAYAIGFYSVDKTGTLTHSEDISSDEARQLVLRLRERGYIPENGSIFTVEVPRMGFTATALDNLKKIISSKAELLKQAVGTDTLEVVYSENTLQFPWFTLHDIDGEADAYVKLITGICDMAKRQKRVIARERPITNAKFSMRVFLIRLGFIGPEYQTARMILLRNLTGNSSWLAGRPLERRRLHGKRMSSPLSLTLPFSKGSNLLDGLTYWLTTYGVTLSEEDRSDEHGGAHIVTVRWQNQNYNIIQMDGVTCKIEQV